MNSDWGGMADYGLHQALALRDQSVEVLFLCSPEYIHREKLAGIRVVPTLHAQKSGQFGLVRKLLGDIKVLCTVAQNEKPSAILFCSYYEYLAPLWAWKLRRLKKQLHLKIASVIHDPIRDYRVGPAWWHEWSIREGYSFLDVAFLHEDEKIPFQKEKISIIPHGLYSIQKSQYNRADLRNKFNIPEDAFVILSFGFIRDGKNLDLLIKSLKKIPDAYLIIAGREQSRTQKPISFYQELSRSESVFERCLWHNRFIAEEEIGDFFEVSDIVALTYSGDFRSASGVLNSTIYLQRPLIASGGASNLQNVVKKYSLGVWVQPDSPDAIIQGINQFRKSVVIPDYDRYSQENSWKKNAEIVLRIVEKP
ncbi:glycosyltransferase [Oscillatoria amoena NRMC-F 0135]|nr:glycosyltransferase [Oscillatoria laete-virens]MDL5047213.1 glycosyltransferase [Oscillatoria amoena NRMC-F 0135]MDL5052558.1 glycosyltransferase [Oscillatoria laete-virens NRMC-F 0139]